MWVLLPCTAQACPYLHADVVESFLLTREQQFDLHMACMLEGIVTLPYLLVTVSHC